MADVVKYGIQIPNRVFVGGVAFDTKEDELKDFFSQYGKIKECKIIKDNQSISRGFAFVTFECKHDAIQTQQLGTVFFKQKKLNLGPAIRQKGVVFNGATTTELENEPVLSTGVYVHPSGYCYTVAPNGVWYFHNSDGSPRARTRGSPAMSYSPTLVKTIQQTTQEYQAASPVNSVTIDQPDSTTFDCQSPVPFPVFHTGESPEMHPPYHQATPIIQNQTHQPATGYVHHTHSTIGSSNIHVAFQNMSISSLPTSPSLPTHHVRFATSPNPHAQSPSFAAHSTIQTMNAPPPLQQHTPMTVPVQYARVGDMYVPYYASHNLKHALDGSGFDSHHTVPPHTNGNCQYQIPLQQKQDFYSMMPNNLRDTYMTTCPAVYNPYHPTVVYPPHTPAAAAVYNSPPVSETQFCYKKSPRYSHHGMKGRTNYATNYPSGYYEKDSALKVETKCA